MFILCPADESNREGAEHIAREYANEWDALLFMQPCGADGDPRTYQEMVSGDDDDTTDASDEDTTDEWWAR